MDQATLLRGKPGKIMLAGAAFLLLVAIPYLFAHFRQGQRAANRGESTVKVERKNFGQVLRLNGTTQASRSFVVLAPKLEGAQVETVPEGPESERRAALWGQLLMIGLGGGLFVAGAIVSTVGLTSVFVPTDLTFLGAESGELRSANSHLLPFIAHDRAGFGGALMGAGWQSC